MEELAIIMIKPDAIRRNLTGEIVSLIRQADLHITSTKSIQLTESTIRAFQPVMNEPSEFGEEWKQEVIAALSAAPVIVMLVLGENALVKSNRIKRSIRKQYAPGDHYLHRVVHNLIHATDTSDEVSNHLEVFFPEVVASKIHQPSPTFTREVR